MMKTSDEIKLLKESLRLPTAFCYQTATQRMALEYIEQLERERDAAMKDMKKMVYESTDGVVCDLCARKDSVCLDCNFEWCGVKEEKNNG